METLENTLAFADIDRKLHSLANDIGESATLVLSCFNMIMRIWDSMDLNDKPSLASADSPRPVSPSLLPSSLPQTADDDKAPPSVPPNVNLIEPTPENSQKDQPPITQLHPTPPPLHSSTASVPLVVPAVEDIVPSSHTAASVSPSVSSTATAGSTTDALVVTTSRADTRPVHDEATPSKDIEAAATLPADNHNIPPPILPSNSSVISHGLHMSSPGPACRTRSKSPVLIPPGSLTVPEVSPPRTRSRTRSRSPTPLPGTKRKATSDIEEGGGKRKKG